MDDKDCVFIPSDSHCIVRRVLEWPFFIKPCCELSRIDYRSLTEAPVVQTITWHVIVFDDIVPFMGSTAQVWPAKVGSTPVWEETKAS